MCVLSIGLSCYMPTGGQWQQRDYFTSFLSFLLLFGNPSQSHPTSIVGLPPSPPDPT